MALSHGLTLPAVAPADRLDAPVRLGHGGYRHLGPNFWPAHRARPVRSGFGQAGNLAVRVRVRSRDDGQEPRPPHRSHQLVRVRDRTVVRTSHDDTWALQEGSYKPGVPDVAGDEGSMLQPPGDEVLALGRPRDHGLRPVDVVRCVPCRYGAKASGDVARSHRSRRQLRAGELPLGHALGTERQPAPAAPS